MNKTNLIVFFAIFLCFSFKRKYDQEELKKMTFSIIKEYNETLPPKILGFEFPDTVPAKTIISGKILYDRDIDKTELVKLKERYVFFEVTTNKDSVIMNSDDIEQLEFFT